MLQRLELVVNGRPVHRLAGRARAIHRVADTAVQCPRPACSRRERHRRHRCRCRGAHRVPRRDSGRRRWNRRREPRHRRPLGRRDRHRDQYKDPAIAPLRYAAADAESLFRFLTTRGGVKPVNVRLLLNRDATGIASGEMPQGRSAHTRYAMTRPFSRSPCSVSKSR